MEIIDISPEVSDDIAVWPGDVPYESTVAMDMKCGDNLTLSSIRTTVHVGAHVDAPNHYCADGEGIGERSLGFYYGAAQVITVHVEPGTRIEVEHVRVPVSAERVLFRTGSYPNPREFNSDFCALSPGLVESLHQSGVRLIGIDTPSVDLFEDKELLSHGSVAKRGMAVLEGIVLDGVEDGLYTLAALPLKLRGADASPVRAVLLREAPGFGDGERG